MKKNYWLAIALTLLLIIVLIAMSNAAPTGSCGPGLASQDLAGTCRANPMTMGALEAVTPRVPPKPRGVRLIPPKPDMVKIK